MIVLLIAARLYRQRNRKPPSNGLLIFTAVMCLILLGVKAERESGIETIAEDADRKLVAITFDDDVIIGLSQEISYKEAVSMI